MREKDEIIGLVYFRKLKKKAVQSKHFWLIWQINPPTFGTFFIQVDGPFETIRSLWFWMVK